VSASFQQQQQQLNASVPYQPPPAPPVAAQQPSSGRVSSPPESAPPLAFSLAGPPTSLADTMGTDHGGGATMNVRPPPSLPLLQQLESHGGGAPAAGGPIRRRVSDKTGITMSTGNVHHSLDTPTQRAKAYNT